MARLAPEEGFDLLKNQAAEAVKDIFPIKKGSHTLHLKDISVKDDKDIEDLRSQKQARLDGRSWTVPVEGQLELVDDETGKVIDKRKTRLMNLPKATNRHSYIVDGHEYQLDNQWRLKPGVYSRVNQTGELESMFNLKGMHEFKVKFDPKSANFTMRKGDTNIPLYPLLKEMGVSDEKLEDSWGKDVLRANQQAKGGNALERFYRAVKKRKPESEKEAREHLHEFMDSASLDPEVAKLTLGQETSKLSGDVVARASQKLLGISRGDEKPDNRENLMFKTFNSAEDFVGESIRGRSDEIVRRIGNNLGRKSKIGEIVNTDMFDKPVEQLFTKTSLSERPDQTNPLETISGAMKTTIMGDLGGITSGYRVTQEAKLVDPSHLGFLDPIHTPESDRTGVTLHLPLGAQKKGNQVSVKMWNTKTGKMESVDPKKAYHSNIALPDQIRWDKGKPTPIGDKVKFSGKENEIEEGSMKDVDYVMAAPAQLFSPASNLVPFMQNTSGGRSTMAGRHMEQAIPLKYREAPLVQPVVVDGKPKTSINNLLGNIASHRSPVSGEVIQIKDDGIVIKREDGKKREVQIYDDFPVNDDKGFINSTPLVKKGDKIKAGQVVADSNYTKNGDLALGTNLRAAYVPYHGYNFEDGVVISEGASRKLTSEHMHRKGVDLTKRHVQNKDKFIAYYGADMTKDQAVKLDDQGVIKKGQQVKPGDTLLATLRERDPDDPESKIMARMHKSLVGPYQDASVKWEADHPGVVTNVVKRGKRTEVHVKTEEAAEIGDKLCFDLSTTEVLTKEGWKWVSDITLNDACYTIKDGIIELQEPTEIHHYPVGGEMYRLRSQQVDLDVTSNHNLYIKQRDAETFALEEARQVIGKCVRHKKNGVWRRESPSHFALPSLDAKEGGKGSRKCQEAACRFEDIPLQSWATFLGIYLANGSFEIVERSDRPGSMQYRTIIHTIEGQHRSVSGDQYQWIMGVLDECGFPYTRRPDRLIISSKQLTLYVSQFGHAGKKFVPRECFGWGADAAGWLLNGLCGCDGCKQISLSYCTTSEQLSDDVQVLALHRGWAADVKRTEPSNARWSVRYDVRIVVTKCEPQINHGHIKSQKPQSERIYISDHPVVGITIPNGTLYVRVNGKAVWTGNSGRHGNKGIITRIVPDKEMPKTKDGRVIDVALNPSGVPGRLNLGQVLETAAGKIAEKTGKPYMMQNFDGTQDWTDRLQKELKKNGLEDKEELFDGKTGRSIGKALSGPHYMHKLKQQISKKTVSRAGGPGYAYDLNRVPKSGGPHGAQALDALGMYALLGHGATKNIRDMQTYKSNAEGNDEMWSALQAGEMLPPPKPTFAYNKFVGYLKTMGVNVNKQGSSLNLVPLVDKDVLEMSGGELKDAGRMIIAKTEKEEKGGLFDKTATGGLEGTKWSHIKLPEKMPNPVFEKAIRGLTGLKKNELDLLMSGKKALDTKTGAIVEPEDGVSAGKAVEHLLKKIDVGKDLAEAEKRLGSGALKGGALNKANLKVKYLRNLQRVDMTPTEAYMTQNVPVMPPSMRPLSVRPDGKLINDDMNHMYKGLALNAKKLKDTSKLHTPEEWNARRGAVYDAMKSLSGVGGHLNREHRGVMDIIRGQSVKDGKKSGSPGEGFFQSRLIKRRQDMSMRSTIIPEPDLGLDEVGIPRKAAMEIYKPFVVKELKELGGMTPLKAKKAIKENDTLAQRALERVTEQRPVLLKRDPVLHKYGVQAFKPVLTRGKAVKIHPLVTSGFNADFDGNCIDGSSELVVRYPKFIQDAYVGRSESEGTVKFAPESKIVACDLDRGIVNDCIEIKDFPREDAPYKHDKNGAAVYRVFDGIQVLSYDHLFGDPTYEDVTEMTIEENCPTVEVQYADGHSVIASTNESLCVYDHETGTLKKSKPEESIGAMSPIVPAVSGDRYDKMYGWMIGAFISDGFFTNGRIGITKLSERYRERFGELLCRFGEVMGSHTYKRNEKHLGDLGECSAKDHYKVGEDLLNLFADCYTPEYQEYIRTGVRCDDLKHKRAALFKRLPSDIGDFSREALLGVLSGLLDGDGTLSWSNAKSKRQLLISFSTSSKQLSEDLRHLGHLLNVRCSTSPVYPDGKRVQKHINYVTSFSIVDIECLIDDLDLVAYKDILAELKDNPVSKDDRDVVPVPFQIMMKLSSRKSEAFGSDPKLCRSLAVLKSANKLHPRVSRSTAYRMLSWLDLDDEIEASWSVLVKSAVRWSYAKDFVDCGERTVYDLVIPTTKIFAVNNGLVVWDTMAAFVPLSTDAVREAHTMYPSRNLFAPATGALMYKPTKESQLGLYMLGRQGKATSKTFKTAADAAKAAHDGQIGMTDSIKIGTQKTTVGRQLIANTLPKEMRADVLSGKVTMEGGGQTEMLTRLAKDFKNDYGDVVNKIKDLGNTYASTSVTSIGLEDIKVDKKLRDRVLSAADKKVAEVMAKSGNKEEKQKKAIQIYDQASEAMVRGAEATHGKNPSALYHMMKAGVKPSMEAYRQIKMSPMLMMNAKGEVIPHPIRKSYSEGLDVGDYWTSMSGARKGAIQKVQSVRDPGYLTKQVMNAVMNNPIGTNDCGTGKGIALPTEEKDVLDRYLASDTKAGRGTFKAGTLITPKVRDSLRNNKVGRVVVRSPLRCEHGTGICAKCYGLDENGVDPPVGKNVGIISGQAIGERATQLSMRAFHTGGVAPVGKKAQQTAVITDQFERVNSLVQMYDKVPGSATLATASGKITKVQKDPAGGTNVFIGDQRHYIPRSRGEPVSVAGGKTRKLRFGMAVQKGDPLSGGPINPHELLPLAGINKVQGYIAGELHNLYKGEGIRRRNIETVVKSMTNLTKVEDPGDSKDFLRGDFAPTSHVQSLNKQLGQGKKRPIQHRPVLKGVKMLPLDMQTDWLARLNHERLQDTIVDAANQGWKSDIHGTHPVPGIVYGSEFGKGKFY